MASSEHSPSSAVVPSPPSSTPDASVPLAPAGPLPAAKITRGHSCILCQQRKVKCDRQKPCSNCIKARVECVASPPTATRRRRRKFSEQDLGTRLRKYEQLLRKHGIKIDDEDEIEQPRDATNPGVGNAVGLSLFEVPNAPKSDTGILYTEGGNSRYVENTLWENLRDEIEDPREALQASSDDETYGETGMYPDANLYPDPENFLLAHGPMKDLSSFHPQPVQIFRLWQTFLNNVNPLVKIFHAPTVQQMVLDASGDLRRVPKPAEALLFAIYLLAVTSLQNEDCINMFGETRNKLLTKYSYGVQHALINAKLLKTLNLTTVQAYTLYLLALRKVYDSQSMWVLTGTVVRIAQRLGIHRDGRSQLSIFDAEMRRRLWWQIVFLDSGASKLAGAGFPSWLGKYDVAIPLNVSDNLLDPGMKEAPVPPTEGVTEMLFCCLRYEVAMQVRKSGSLMQVGQTWQPATGPHLIAQKDKAIDELEAQFHEKYIRYCDPSIPFHLLAIYMTKGVICTMRLMAHHPRQYPDKGASMPQKEKDMLFNESMKELEISAMGESTKAMQRYVWHIHVHFQLDAFIFILSELRTRISGPQVEKAWRLIELSFEQRPEMLTQSKNHLYFAIGNLTLKAWAKREEAGHFEHNQIQVPPRYISVLRSQRRLVSPTANSLSNMPVQITEYQPQKDAFTRTPRTIDAAHMNHGEQSYNHTYQHQHQHQLPQQHHSLPMPQNMQNPPNPHHNPWGDADYNDVNNTGIMEIDPADWEYYQTLMDGDLPAYPQGPTEWVSLYS